MTVENKTLYLHGKFKWAKVFPQNKTNGYEDKYKDQGGVYDITLQMDEENYNALRDSGSLKVGKKLEDDTYEVTFSRPAEVYNKAGEIIPEFSGPPKIVQEDGKTPWEDGVLIGNDSEGAVRLSINTYKRAGTGKLTTSTRLDVVRVDSLVEYEEPDEKEVLNQPEFPF